MKLPLLLHAVPRIAVGPTVLLTKGKWRIESNHIDSEIRIALNSSILTSLLPSQPTDLDLEEDSYASIGVNSRGSEKEITVYAIQL